MGYLLTAAGSSNAQPRLLTLDVGISTRLLKLKKVGKTTRPFRYDLNQIPYNYTVKMTNRFKGLDLIDRLPAELWMEVHNIEQEALIKAITKKINAERQNGC